MFYVLSVGVFAGSNSWLMPHLSYHFAELPDFTGIWCHKTTPITNTQWITTNLCSLLFHMRLLSVSVQSGAYGILLTENAHSETEHFGPNTLL